jgi:hypothetical protein
MYFVPEQSDSPPYYPLPKTAYNVTRGQTWYHVIDARRGLINMRESYYDYCIPVFGDPTVCICLSLFFPSTTPFAHSHTVSVLLISIIVANG